MSLTYESKCLVQLNINWNISLFEREWEDVIGIENSRIESNNKNYEICWYRRSEDGHKIFKINCSHIRYLQGIQDPFRFLETFQKIVILKLS